MSSRLFQEVREIRGLCYSISSFHMAYSDTGFFGIYAGTDDNDAPELMQVVMEEMERAASTITEAEVARAKAQMKATLLMALESSSARAEQIARHIMIYGRPLPLPEIVAKIDAVTVESTQAAGAGAARAQPPGDCRAWTGPRTRSRRRNRGEFRPRDGIICFPFPRKREAATEFWSGCPQQIAGGRYGVFPFDPCERNAARRLGRRRISACRADVGLPAMDGVAREEPRFSHSLGADMAGRRSDSRLLPPPPQALFRGHARRLRLSVSAVPQGRQCAARRHHADQYPPRRRAIGQPRLLDRRSFRASGLYDARASPRWCPSPSRACGCTASRPPAFRPTSPR